MVGEVDAMTSRVPLSPSTDAVAREPICSTKTDRVPIEVERPALHRFILNITTTNGNAIFLDNFEFNALSIPEDIAYGDYSRINPSGEAVNFTGSGWQPVFSIGKSRQRTSVEGSKVSVLFYGTLYPSSSISFSNSAFLYTGTAVELQGYLESSMSRIPSMATFSIDDGEETEFTLPTYSDGFRGLPIGTTRWRVPILITPPVPIGRHILSITHRGNASTVPLTVDSFIVANLMEGFGSLADFMTGASTGTTGTITGPGSHVPSNTVSSSTGQGPAATKGADPNGGGSKADLGLIVGAVVGGIVAVLILLVALLIYCRREGLSRGHIAAPEIFSPFDFWPLQRFGRMLDSKSDGLPRYPEGEKQPGSEHRVVHLRYHPSDAPSHAHDDDNIDAGVDVFSLRPPSSTAEAVPSYHSGITVPLLDSFERDWKNEETPVVEPEESGTLPPKYSPASG